MNKINEATLFLLKSEKKTNEGHLKQMREVVRNIFFIWPLKKMEILFLEFGHF